MQEAYSFENTGDYPEAHDYIMKYAVDNSVETYLNLIKEAKKVVDIPVIASINCTSEGEWMAFAKKIEAAGADALELNIYFLASDKVKSPSSYEAQYLSIASQVRKMLSIPVSVKMAKTFTNVSYMVDQLYFRKVNGVVLFNRLYEPDINIEKMKVVSAEVLSHPADLRDTLRWIGIVSSAVPSIDIAASTGVHNGDAVVKLLLAGAKVVEVCSVIYKNGTEVIPEMLKDIQEWMEKNSYHSIDEFRGAMNYKKIQFPEMYERAQFMKYYSSYE